MANKTSILLDVSPALDSRKSGVGYYVDRLAESMSKQAKDAYCIYGYYFNFFNKQKKDIDYLNINNRQVTYIPGKIIPLLGRFGRQPFLETFIPKKYDVTLFTNYVALPSIKKTPYALVIYDLGFIDHPEFVQQKNLRYLTKYSTKSILNANLIITISDFTKQRIKDVFPDIKASIIVTPIPPVKKVTSGINLQKRLLDLGIAPKKYILYLGTLEPRKNLVNLIKAFKRLPSGQALVLAGGKGWKDEEINSAIKTARAKGCNIITPGYVNDTEKDALYSNACAFVLPSHYEGFGMPILEAMQHNTPLAISDIPVFHEVAGDGAVYFNKDDPKDMANSISELITNPTLHNKILSKYKIQLDKSSWDTNAKLVLQGLEDITNK